MTGWIAAIVSMLVALNPLGITNAARPIKK